MLVQWQSISLLWKSQRQTLFANILYAYIFPDNNIDPSTKKFHITRSILWDCSIRVQGHRFFYFNMQSKARASSCDSEIDEHCEIYYTSTVTSAPLFKMYTCKFLLFMFTGCWTLLPLRLWIHFILLFSFLALFYIFI